MTMGNPEPMPHPGSQDVAPSLKQRFGDFIDDRTNYGEDKYGHPLQTHNGRDPRVDMTQEILDFTQYQEQDRMELAYALTQARAEIENLTTQLDAAKAKISVLSETLQKAIPPDEYHRIREQNDSLREQLYDAGSVPVDPCAEDDLI